jgi:2-polyprenyl-3-methyl-5-hydroxy-6-metoxy-1,4-benzoquinol methylase
MRRVNPKIYTKEYYLTDCTGHEEFKKYFGEKFEPRFIEILQDVKIDKDMRVLDIGCGRGELVYYSAKIGAEAYGIDYSINAIKLANVLKDKKINTIRQRMHFSVMDAKKIKFTNSFFDVVFLTDVVEHLYPEELELVFREIKRVLKPRGQVVIHTAPNKIFNDYTYKYFCYPVAEIIVKLWNLLTNKRYPNIAEPKNLRVHSHSEMHINEPTFFSLKKLFNKFNFTGSIKSTNITVRKENISFKDDLFNFLVFLDPVSRYFPINIIFGSDFFSVLRNKK